MKNIRLYGQSFLNLYCRGKINAVQHPIWTWKYILMKSVPLTVPFLLLPLSSQLVHLKFNTLPLFFPPTYVSAQKRLMKRNSCTHTSRSCCSYRFEVCTCMELGDWRFFREGDTMEHQGSKARGMDGFGVANWIPHCSPGGHRITPEMN